MRGLREQATHAESLRPSSTSSHRHGTLQAKPNPTSHPTKRAMPLLTPYKQAPNQTCQPPPHLGAKPMSSAATREALSWMTL